MILFFNFAANIIKLNEKQKKRLLKVLEGSTPIHRYQIQTKVLRA